MIQSFWLDDDWLWIGMRDIHLILIIFKAKIELAPVSQKVVNRTIYDLFYDPLPTRFATVSQNFRFATCGYEDIFVRRYEDRSIYSGRAPIRWIYFSCSGSIWIVKLHWLDKCLLFTINDQNITLLVHAWFLLSNRQKRNSVSADVTDDTPLKTFKERRFFQLFSDNLGVVFEPLDFAG